MSHGFPSASLLILANRGSVEHPVRLLRADSLSADVSCDAAVVPNTPVRLSLTDGTVLGRVAQVRSGVISIVVDYVNPATPPVVTLLTAVAEPDRVRCPHPVPSSR
jgi:hypothetical protein